MQIVDCIICMLMSYVDVVKNVRRTVYWNVSKYWENTN